ncbi:unnamed protein product [Fraxinus pennsylvanica]|uniref:Alcohol dehydrogenase-like C-terminal domain-containing protein n=1 Tax=Fraxinus pennsylvanica TaxID=56036 RepID=A0AAD1ZM36_9LAMI|nr:unnamed protein product [Fraxinus pennsylvanica]
MAEKIRELTNGGVHYSFECAGNLDVLREAFLSTHDGWGLTVVSGIHPTPRMLPLHPMELFDGRRIVGSVFGDFKGKSQLPQFANQCMNGVKYLYTLCDFDPEKADKLKQYLPPDLYIVRGDSNIKSIAFSGLSVQDL